MTNSNNDIEELEELLTELEGQEARLVAPYSEEDDAVTQLMDAPLGDQEWMVQVTALDRRMMSTDQLLSELQTGKVSNKTLVWRGGMDDWLPVSRVDELARMSRPPSSPMARSSLGSLPPPPAPLPPPPAWSTAAGASLPPPPTALPPPPSAMGLPRPRPLPVPAPMAPEPQTNTTRPVAVDFADLPAGGGGPLQSKRVVMALSAAAILAGFVTLYAVFGGGGDKSSAETEAAAQPQAVNSLKPAVQEKQEKQEKKMAAPAPAPKPAEAKPEPAAVAEADSPSAEGSGSTSARATNAPARYAPRTDARRRTRGSSASESGNEAEEAATSAVASAEAPAPSAPAPAVEAPSSEVVAAADDDADSAEAPKSTAKGNSTFNRDAAKTALDEAATQAKNCRPQGGPSGTGRVQVRYEPSGKVAAVSILTSKFENTTAGSCVRMLFRRARVPEFTGVPVVVVNKSFEIP